MRYLILVLGSVFSDRLPQAPVEPDTWGSPVVFPKGMKGYTPAKSTQTIYVLSNEDVIHKTPISELESKWQVSGGMVGVSKKLWRSNKYYLIPGKIKYWVGTISVKNSSGYEQDNRAIKREYPEGTRFDDVLSANSVVFEHRSREKVKGKWVSSVLYEDKSARPEGYTGLTSTCASCHNKAGTGMYDSGLVPGGDTILSDPLDWTVAKHVQGRR